MGSYFALFKISDKLDDGKEYAASSWYRIFRMNVLPVITVFFLCLWEELFLWGRINSALMARDTISIPNILLYLTLTGIIPVRIIMALQPPFSPIGSAIGLISTGYFIYSVIGLIHYLF